jgi:hypothetical protein
MNKFIELNEADLDSVAGGLTNEEAADLLRAYPAGAGGIQDG